jgi:uncharacterized protein (DUF362 family)
MSGAAAFAGMALPQRLPGQEVQFPPAVPANQVYPYESRSPVALVKGDDRRKNVTEALLAVDREIAPALNRKKYVAIKVNNVDTRNQLAATHVDAIRGILDYLEPRFKGEVMIVESSMGNGLAAFENFKYAQVIPEYKKFNIQLIDLNREAKYEVFPIIDSNIRPVPVRLAARLLDPDAFIISSAMLKTHDNVVATATIKNMAMGAPLILAAGPGQRGASDKGLMHAWGSSMGRGGAGRGGQQAPGSGAGPQAGGPPPAGMGPGVGPGAGGPPQAAGGAPGAGVPGGGPAGAARGGGMGMRERGYRYHAMNYNLAVVAKKLSGFWGCGVIDGFEGMEGNGPIQGTAIKMGVALASPDLVAADRVALDLMMIPPHAVGYLQYAGALGVGQYDISKIDVRGEKPETLARKFKMRNNVEEQLDWLHDIVRPG